MGQTALKRLQVAQRHTTLSGHNQRPYSYQRPPPGSPRAPPAPGPPPLSTLVMFAADRPSPAMASPFL